MKNRLLLAAALVLIGFIAAGCQTMSPFAQSGTVLPRDRVALASGQHSGEWHGDDVTVDYRYSRNEHDMDLSGTARFNSNLTFNFSILRDFQLSTIFTDSDGRVLGTQPLATNRGNFEPTPFHARLVPPPGTADISFAYQGTAFSVGDEDGGGGGPTSFWQYPVH